MGSLHRYYYVQLTQVLLCVASQVLLCVVSQVLLCVVYLGTIMFSLGIDVCCLGIVVCSLGSIIALGTVISHRYYCTYLWQKLPGKDRQYNLALSSRLMSTSINFKILIASKEYIFQRLDPVLDIKVFFFQPEHLTNQRSFIISLKRT